MRTLFSLVALCLVAALAPAADLGPVITTTDGCKYVRGADGHYYPAGSLAPSAKPACVCGDSCACPPATCPAKCPVVNVVSNTAAGDGLDAVNAKRAARGLRPYLRDDGLTAAAKACAEYRAARGIFGHVNDFAFLPAGTRADATGCAAYPASYGFMACAIYDDYTHAGAYSVQGPDGRTFHHLFVRGGSGQSAPAYLPAPVAQPFAAPVYLPSCPNGQCQQPATFRRR